jgi:hypothetical protein
MSRRESLYIVLCVEMPREKPITRVTTLRGGDTHMVAPETMANVHM